MVMATRVGAGAGRGGEGVLASPRGEDATPGRGEASIPSPPPAPAPTRVLSLPISFWVSMRGRLARLCLGARAFWEMACQLRSQKSPKDMGNDDSRVGGML